MKKLNILIFLVVSVFVFGQAEKQILKPNFSNNDLLEIPFQYVNNLFYIDLKIKGENEKFIFDTGSFPILTKIFAEKHNLPLKRKTSARGYSGKIDLYGAPVMDIELRGREIRGFSFSVIDLKFLNKLNIAGIVGTSVFSEIGYNAYTIDYKSRKIILGTKAFQDYDFAFKLRERGYPRIEVGKESYLIDTGNPLFGEFMAKKYDVSDCSKISNTSLSFTNKNLDLCSFSIQDNNGNSFKWKSIKTKNPQNVIGNLVLQNYLIHIDRGNDTVYFKKNHSFPVPNDLYFIKDFDGYFVAVINEDSDAYKKGLREGDRLINIKGEQISNFHNSEQLHNYLLNHSEILIIKRGEETFQTDNFLIK